MIAQPIVVEATFNVAADKVWSAITNNDEMVQWYFNLSDFKPEVGFVFEFTGGKPDEIQYVHHCEITEVIPGKRLTHTWKYIGYPGESTVCWELITEEDKTTTLKLTHAGLESLPPTNEDFAKDNFLMGWNYIINTSLSNYLQSSN